MFESCLFLYGGEKMSNCTYSPCPECGGTGGVWISFNGEHIGRYRIDDLDELDVCPECNGSGIFQECDMNGP